MWGTMWHLAGEKDKWEVEKDIVEEWEPVYIQYRLMGYILYKGVKWDTKKLCRIEAGETEPVLSPVQATDLNICSTFSNLIRVTIGQRWSRLGEDGGGQKSPHRRQNILSNTPKNHIPWCHCSQIWTSFPRSKHSNSSYIPSLLRITWHKTFSCKNV